MRSLLLRPFISTFAVCLVIFGLWGRCQEVAAADTTTPVAALLAYREAVLAADGEAAWEIVDERTHRYYEKMLKDAINASRQELQKVDMLMRLGGLRCRMEFTATQMRAMNARGLFVEAVKRQWIDRASMQTIGDLRERISDGTKAMVEPSAMAGHPGFQVVKEPAGWRMDLAYLMDLSVRIFQQMAKQNEMGENEFIEKMLAQLKQTAFEDSLWDGPRK